MTRPRFEGSTEPSILPYPALSDVSCQALHAGRLFKHSSACNGARVLPEYAARIIRKTCDRRHNGRPL